MISQERTGSLQYYRTLVTFKTVTSNAKSSGGPYPTAYSYLATIIDHGSYSMRMLGL
jgi:hypothetical protein